MKIAILTSSIHGTASRCLPVLACSDRLIVVGVVLVRRVADTSVTQIARKLRKLRRIGLLGAVNGVRLRKWYRDDDTEDLRHVCRQYSVPLTDVPFTNCVETQTAIRDCGAELVLSLGNGYIREDVFSIPAKGMINVHGELLPDFKGAQSVIWPIYEGVTQTGFTIHRMSRKIDDGQILFREAYPITFDKSLRITVAKTLAVTRARIPHAVRFVCENYDQLGRSATVQVREKIYTTPTWSQFAQIQRNHQQLYDSSVIQAAKAQP